MSGLCCTLSSLGGQNMYNYPDLVDKKNLRTARLCNLAQVPHLQVAELRLESTFI